MLAAVILSGGASRRMGAPKALSQFRGKSFLEHLLGVTTHAEIGVRRVVLGADAAAICEAVPLAPSEIVLNPDWQRGQLSSLHAGLRSLPKGTDGMLLCLIDHPLVSAALVDQLVEHFYANDHSIVVPVCGGRRGHPVIFSAKLYDELFAAPLEQGARSVVWTHGPEVGEVITEDDGCLWNVNDPEVLAKLATARG